MDEKTKRIALIPAYQPGEDLPGLLMDVRSLGMEAVIVDDGSGAEWEAVFKKCEGLAHLLRHEKNQGKGQALKTGLAYLRKEERGEKYAVVTMDADGQHRPEDALRVLREAEEHPGELVLGCRAFLGKIPFRSRFGNTLTRLVFRIVSGTPVSDTQTGLRAFRADLIPFLLTTQGARYEYEMNMLLDCPRAGVRIREVPIRTIYIGKNESSHFDTVKDSLRIYREILKRNAIAEFWGRKKCGRKEVKGEAA